MEYLVKISKKACILELKRRNMKKTDSDIQYAVSIKEDMVYMCLHFTKDHEGNKIQYANSTCLDFRKKYRLNLKNDMPPRDKSPDFDLFSDEEEYSEEEVAETMDETMEQYMRKTQANYRSRSLPYVLNWSRKSLAKKQSIWFDYNLEDLKTKFLRKYCPPTRTVKKRSTTFSKNQIKTSIKLGSDLKNLMKCPQHYLTEMQEVVLFYNRLDVPTRQILDSRGAIPSKTAADAKVAIQETTKYFQKWQNGSSRTRSTETSDGLAAIQAQLNNLEREIKKVNEKVYVAQVGCEQCKGLHYIKDFPLKEEGKTFEEAYYTQFGASLSVMPLSTYINLGLGELTHAKLTLELAYRTMKYPKGIAKNVLVGIGKVVFLVDFIILDMPEDIKVPLILRRPFLSTPHAKIDVFKRNITLRVREEKIIFKSVKPASSLIKRVYMLSLIERIELDLEAKLMGETLVLNRSLDPLFEDYIELNDLNVPLNLRRDQVDDLIPNIKEGEVVEEFRARNDARMVSEIFRYPSNCNHDKKIRIDCAYNLKFSCMISFEFSHANFFPILYINVMSKKFYNSIRKDKLEYKGNNVVEALINIPIFVVTFSILTDFVVLEDMDAYHDGGMGDVIFGELFLREVRINARRFEGMMTIYNGNEEVTYQMVRSHPRYKGKEIAKPITPPSESASEEDNDPKQAQREKDMQKNLALIAKQSGSAAVWDTVF
nr:hypothetical protein [Tanacetum cinerariifolium]